MSSSTFKTAIRSGIIPLGTLVTTGSPETVEMLSMSGLDWLFFDMEHGALDTETVGSMLRAVRGECLAMVRVPENTCTWIRRVLDLGCDGIIVPQVNSPQDARRAVDCARYPPMGHRSVGLSRAHGYGLQFAEYVTHANERISVIVQIEHIDGVRAVDDILDVDGIDGVLIGPYDLSGSLHLLGQVEHPTVQEAIARVCARCSERDMPFGLFVLDPGSVSNALHAGASFLAVGTDLSLLNRIVQQIRADFSRESRRATN